MSTSRTYATLRVFIDDRDPDEISAVLRVAPTRVFRSGEPRAMGAPYRSGGWFLSTQELDSLEVGDHIDHLLGHAEGARAGLSELATSGVRSDVLCYWATDDGQGGPSLSANQMQRLAALGLPVAFDVYFTGRT